MKIARSYTGRHGIITFGNGFHGRSFMTMAMTGKTAPYKRDFGVMPAGVPRTLPSTCKRYFSRCGN